MPRYSPKASLLIARRMRDFYAGRMRSSSGDRVTSPAQAKAIALSEARAKGLRVPQPKGSHMPRVGQFKKGGGRVTDGRKQRKTTSRALVPYRGGAVVRARAPVVVYRTRHVKVPVKSRRSSASSGRALMRRELGSGEFIPGPFRMRSGAIAGLLGYAESGKGLTGVKDLIEKIPTMGKVPKEAIAGLVLNYFADRAGDWGDAGAQALLDVGLYKLGQQGFAFSGEDDD